DFTVPEDQGLVIPGSTPGPAKTLIIGAGKTFTYNGPVTIEAGGNLVLATDSTTAVGKIAGTGSIIAGETAITGAWEAVAANATPGTLTITSAAAGATITADGTNATGLKASATGATITQKAGDASNTLTIGATGHVTIIDLDGTTTGAVGKLVVSGGANPGKVAFAVIGATVQIGANPTLGTAVTSPTAIGGMTFGTSSVPIHNGTGSSGDKFLGMKATAATNTFVGGNASNTITIDSTQDVTT
ncbi:MAG: hypothetical protein LBB78_07000, partial [Spirochaetaceae bacterium]|nr:hypothetical protein [Spirochaetaceae bacterium]